MVDNVALDVAITWAGAAGCAYYLRSLYAHGRPGSGAQRFLMLLFTSLLFVRGLAWLSGDPSSRPTRSPRYFVRA